MRMAEAVGTAHADQGRIRRPHIKRLSDDAVAAAMVGHLQHLDRTEHTFAEHPVLRGLLDIAGEHHVERSPPHVEHDARVVHRELRRRIFRWP